MKLQKYRWSSVYESAEEELIGIFKRNQISAKRYVVEAAQELEPSVSQSDVRMWCAEGSATITIDTIDFSMQPGDTLDIPANTMYVGNSGLGGYVFYTAEFAVTTD